MPSITAVAATTLALCAALPGATFARDDRATVPRSAERMDAIVSQSERQLRQIVALRMQDPAVQRAWQAYLQRSGGRPAMDYPTFTDNFVYINGFGGQTSADAAARDTAIQPRGKASVQALDVSAAGRGQAQRAADTASQQEWVRALAGNGSYLAPDGQPLQLPQTWQPNTTVDYQGRTYHVDAAGNYHVRAANGWWYPLQPDR